MIDHRDPDRPQQRDQSEPERGGRIADAGSGLSGDDNAGGDADAHVDPGSGAAARARVDSCGISVTP